MLFTSIITIVLTAPPTSLAAVQQVIHHGTPLAFAQPVTPPYQLTIDPGNPAVIVGEAYVEAPGTWNFFSNPRIEGFLNNIFASQDGPIGITFGYPQNPSEPCWRWLGGWSKRWVFDMPEFGGPTRQEVSGFQLELLRFYPPTDPSFGVIIRFNLLGMPEPSAAFLSAFGFIAMGPHRRKMRNAESSHR